MKKVLIITYYWPPAGGPGVQRVLKFAKYLPEFGWQPIILTVKNGEYPAYDESLQKDIPDSCKVYKTPALEPFSLHKKFTGMAEDERIPTAVLTEKKTNWKKKVTHWIRLNLFIPDAKIGWIPYAVKAGKHIIKKENPDMIFSSSPPPTVHLIAKSLARWSKIRWVADFRDPWTDIYHYEKNKISFFSTSINKKLEKNVLKSANKISCVAKGFFHELNLSYTVIPNGFDKSDINISNKGNKKFFTIRYMGSLKERQYVDSLFEVLKDLSQYDKFKNRIKLEIIGNVFESVRNKIIDKNCKYFDIKFLGYKPHTKAVSLIKNADALLFIIGKGKKGKYITTGKLFEYIMVKKPIIAFGPIGGVANKIITKTNTGKMFDYSDFTEVKNYIIKLFNLWSNDETPEFREAKINKYSRKNLTKKLTKLF